MIDKCVGQRIKELRELNKYTREEFAEEVSISAKYLYEIETGKKNVSTDILCRIAQSLSVSCDYIMLGEAGSNCKEEKIAAILQQMNTKQLIAAGKLFKLMADLCDDMDI